MVESAALSAIGPWFWVADLVELLGFLLDGGGGGGGGGGGWWWSVLAVAVAVAVEEEDIW